jgi:hypothetical protein
MHFTKKKIEDAMRWIHSVALRGSPGVASYTDFCMVMNLGDPHNNKIMDLLLLEVMRECDRRGLPDLASLVVHASGGKKGPGKGWYEGHGYMYGDLPRWERHRDDVLLQAPTFTI